MDIYRAAGAGDLDRLKHLIEGQHTSPSVRGREGNTPLLAAARQGQLAVLSYLVHECGVAVDQTDDAGHTAFFLACNYGRDEAAALLLKLGADPRARDAQNDSALMVASFWGRESTVALILADGRCGLDHRHRSQDQFEGHTALLDTVKGGHFGIAEMLLDAGASPLATDREGRDALHLARSTSSTSTSSRQEEAAGPPPSFVAAFHRARAEPARAALLHRLRFLQDAAHAFAVTGGAVPEVLRGRVRDGEVVEPLPDARVAARLKGTKLGAVVSYALGGGSGEGEGEEGDGAQPGPGLPPDLFTELLDFMLPRWARDGEE